MIEFDPEKDRRNRAKHGVSLRLGQEVLSDPAALRRLDLSADYGEERWIILGLVRGTVHVAVYTERLDHVRIISVRVATRREADAYYRYRESGGEP